MKGLFDFLRSLGAPRLAAMGVVTLGMIGFFAYLIIKLSTPPMAVLFSDLSLEDSAAVVKELERQQIKYVIHNDGSQILVPQDLVPRTRMRLAEGGMPKGGGMGYEIFDKGDALSSTSFVQNINHLRALEGELARTIRAIDRVQAARVHLVLPERALFARDQAEPTASIVLKMRGGLDASQIRAIRHLTASAVKGLSPQRVSIVDESGRLLADGAGDASGTFANSAEERRNNYEKKMREQVESIIASVVGPGRTRVQIAADMDFNRVTQTSDDFDPERRVVRSTQTREEQSQSTEAKDNAVTVGNELPGANNTGGGAGNGTKEANKKSEETVNYEIARTQRTEVIEGGRVKRVSVAVLVDGIYARDAAGVVTYTPRPQEEIDRIAALVRSAIGFDQRRGDQVEIVNLRFAEAPPVPQAIAERPWWMLFEPTKEDLRYLLELGVLLLMTLLVLFVVVRPLMKRIMAPETERVLITTTAGGGGGNAGSHGGDSGHGEGGGVGSVSGGATIQAPALDAEGNPLAPPIAHNETVKRIELAQVAGEVQAQSIAKVAELIDQNPYETVAVLRQWLTTPAEEKA